jgi:hypothetical protein
MNSYFERQTDDSKNCAVHALNNALGYAAIKPEDVVRSIEARLKTFARMLGMPSNDPKLQTYRARLMTNKTFFQADAVFIAAEEKGLIYKPTAVPGFAGTYAQVNDDLLQSSLVVLGVRNDSAYHAVAARNGMIYDSLNRDAAVPLTNDNLALTYKNIFAAFIIIKV